MNDSRRYRTSAADCFSAAQAALRPCDRKLRLSMASSWLSLARQDEEMDRLLASWEEAEPLGGRTLLVSGPIAAVPFGASQSQ